MWKKEEFGSSVREKWNVDTWGGESWSRGGLNNVARRWREKTGSAANSVVKEETGAAGTGEEAGKGAMNWELVQVVEMRCSGQMEGWEKCRITSRGGGTLQKYRGGESVRRCGAYGLNLGKDHDVGEVQRDRGGEKFQRASQTSRGEGDGN